MHNGEQHSMTCQSSSVLPKHVAIIMDGNNRWAKSHGYTSREGHRRGAETARDIVDYCLKSGISILTLFAFSSENWLRPKKEVRALMALFIGVLRRTEIHAFHKKNVRICFVGSRKAFSTRLQSGMEKVENLTAHNTGMTVIVAADYGGRWDLVQAAKKLLEEASRKNLKPSEITLDLFNQYTALGEFPDPDFCIRTGGEKRLSNFLLWQFAYTELYFSDCFWPDFNVIEFKKCLADFSERQRRFGGNPAEVSDRIASCLIERSDKPYA